VRIYPLVVYILSSTAISRSSRRPILIFTYSSLLLEDLSDDQWLTARAKVSKTLRMLWLELIDRMARWFYPVRAGIVYQA